jgi:hypothetical protein
LSDQVAQDSEQISPTLSPDVTMSTDGEKGDSPQSLLADPWYDLPIIRVVGISALVLVVGAGWWFVSMRRRL